MARLRFRPVHRRGEARVEERVRVRRPECEPESVPFGGVPPEVLDLGGVGCDEAAPVDLGRVDWRPAE